MRVIFIDGRACWVAAICEIADSDMVDVLVSKEVRGRKDERHRLPRDWARASYGQVIHMNGHIYSRGE